MRSKFKLLCSCPSLQIGEMNDGFFLEKVGLWLYYGLTVRSRTTSDYAKLYVLLIRFRLDDVIPIPPS